MFGIENSANNFGRSAGLLANTIANRPTTAALGTLFVGSDNLILYRYNGSTWDIISGGGIAGATNGLQVVGTNIGLGGTLTQNTDISGIGSFSFKFQNYSSFAIGNSTEPSMIFDTVAETVITYYNGFANGLNFDYGSDVYTFGDFTGTTNATHFIIDNGSEEITTFSQGFSKGLYLNFANDVYNFGDSSNVTNGTYIMVDNSAQEIKTYDSGSQIGLKLDFANNQYFLGNNELFINAAAGELYFSYVGKGLEILDFGRRCYLGDVVGAFNNTSIYVNDIGQEIITTHNGINRGLLFDFANLKYSLGDCTLIGNGYAITLDDGVGELRFDGANLQSNTAGGNSGEHLVIWLNGSNYKIKLENP